MKAMIWQLFSYTSYRKNSIHFLNVAIFPYGNFLFTLPWVGAILTNTVPGDGICRYTPLGEYQSIMEVRDVPENIPRIGGVILTVLNLIPPCLERKNVNHE